MHQVFDGTGLFERVEVAAVDVFRDRGSVEGCPVGGQYVPDHNVERRQAVLLGRQPSAAACDDDVVGRSELTAVLGVYGEEGRLGDDGARLKLSNGAHRLQIGQIPDAFAGVDRVGRHGVKRDLRHTDGGGGQEPRNGCVEYWLAGELGQVDPPAHQRLPTLAGVAGLVVAPPSPSSSASRKKSSRASMATRFFGYCVTTNPSALALVWSL